MSKKGIADFLYKFIDRGCTHLPPERELRWSRLRNRHSYRRASAPDFLVFRNNGKLNCRVTLWTKLCRCGRYYKIYSLAVYLCMGIIEFLLTSRPTSLCSPRMSNGSQ